MSNHRPRNARTEGAPMLEVEGLSVFYGKTQALDDVSISVERGEIVGVIGPNGAGKTTLLSAISRLIEYEGTVRFDGEDVTNRSSRELVERGLIQTTEDRDLFPFFTVHENLLMGAHVRNDDAIQRDLDRVYELFPRLDERRDQEAETMSGGEQQMLAIGRALMGDPEVLLLDEPTLGLAPVIIQDIGETLSTLQDDRMTVLLAEQNASFAMEHSDRLYLLETGTVERSGTATEFRNDDYVRDAYIGVI
ncbi:ABC transporter ATP-binding protein [Halalkalicoccus ordinarius]|uniref:ABC transporter ATP-binding protein n=1 Tax=Halalkalicoccus ordinarius TaxID=3116651 RepID=UPI00300F0600